MASTLSNAALTVTVTENLTLNGSNHGSTKQMTISGINEVSKRILHLKNYIKKIISKRPNLYGDKSLLGFMPDWNPAEMIGVVPQPLAMSLYRDLITLRTWSIAREKMGYREMPNVELMVSLFGRPYIDVRNSMNSLLPKGLPAKISNKIINAYISRLDKHPYLHDKIEFEVVQTAYDFDIDSNFSKRYPDVLENDEFNLYKSLLKKITLNAISDNEENSLNLALKDIDKLSKIQNEKVLFKENSFSLADNISSLIDECIKLGTLPFAIIARHGFIAESLLRSLVGNNVFSLDRINHFKRNIKTISGEMSQEFNKVLNSDLSKDNFLDKYGHLRPSSYDILSPNYNNRVDLFDGVSSTACENIKPFSMTNDEIFKFKELLKKHSFGEISPEMILDYAEKAIKGREYAKFIFTRHLSNILEEIAKWGSIEGFKRSEMAMLTLNDVKSILFSPLTDDIKSFFQTKINKAKVNFDIASSFKLSYLIRSTRDAFIVPMQRSFPNFIGNKRIEKGIIVLNAHLKNTPNLEDKIICIEGADPGYDWIFTKKIAGLITKYGGANSHMAIRCAEYDLPAAIGCGEQPFERIIKAKKCLLDCPGKRLEPIQVK